jgi:hypothetical protein
MAIIANPTAYGQWVFPQTTSVTGAPIQTIATPTVQPQVSYADKFKAKKVGKKTSHIVFILDYSSSMQSCRDQTIEAFNEFLKSKQTDAKTNGIPTFVSLYTFDGHNIVVKQDRVAVDEFPPLDRETYNPSGMTNLLDAIGAVVNQTNNKLAEFKRKKRDSIITVILTDGQENASKVFKSSDVAGFVKKAEEKNWGFVFLGANIDAFSVGSYLGFSQHNTMQFNTDKIASSMSSLSNMTTRMATAYRTGEDTSAVYASAAFTEDERKAATKGE